MDTKIFLFFRLINTIVISWQKLLLVKPVSDLEWWLYNVVLYVFHLLSIYIYLEMAPFYRKNL